MGAADLNGDGKDDIVWRGADGTVYAWLMNGGVITSQGVISNPGTVWVIADLADMNGDGRSDIVFRNTTDGGVYIFLMNGLSIAAVVTWARSIRRRGRWRAPRTSTATARRTSSGGTRAATPGCG
ncbi:MAG: VCBS repeat-containing protein [Burkholderiales bacterium]|nr:VCBS repeat-containing protein [Burkholderiales bacterium]